MGLVLYAGNDLERLGDRLVAALAGELRTSDPAAVFAEQLVLVPTIGLRDWLRQQVAQRLGICAGIRFVYPAEFFSHLSDSYGLGQVDPRWAERARWHCLAALPDIEALQSYCRSESGRPGRRSYSLARTLADGFERYALYRDEMLAGWAHRSIPEDEPDHAWQAELWRQLLAAGCPDPVEQHRRLLAAIGTGQPSRPLPARLFAFGFNSLSPRLLQVLHALGGQGTVELYGLQPTPGYWGDQRSRRSLLRDQSETGFDGSNRLLGDWGGTGRDFLIQLDDLAVDYRAEAEDFRDPGRDSLLHCLQDDLFRAEAAQAATGIDLAQDHSIEIHACHGLRRQLEVVKEAIHAACAGGDIEAHDIAIMTPDPEQVAPLAAALLQGSGHGPPIPVVIADRHQRQRNPAADVLLRLLALLPGRCTASEVLEFCGCSAISRAWRLEASHIDHLRDWIDQADLRWGVDAAHRQAVLDQAYAAGSWLSGLQALQLGWWYGADTDGARAFRPAQQDDPAEAVLPVPELQPEAAAALAQLTELLVPLFDAAAALRTVQSPDWWARTLSRLLRHALRGDADDADLAQVTGELAAWAEELQELGWQEALTVELVLAHFEDRFAQSAGGDFARGAVTICGLQPMRSIPFRMLCLVGLDDGVFPRQARGQAFDITRQERRLGDRDLRREDRYLLLELLISVRQRLVITYQGFNPVDNSDLAPAAIVGELMDVLAQSCGVGSVAALTAPQWTRHRLHRSLEQSPWPDAAIRDEHRHLLQERRSRRFVPVPLDAPPPGRLDLDTLLAFWRDPAAYYLHQLGVEPVRQREAPRDHERFTAATGLDAWRIRWRLLQADDPADTHDLLAAQGLLPWGAARAWSWQAVTTAIGQLHEAWRELRANAQAHSFRLEVHGVELIGELPHLHPEHGPVHLQLASNPANSVLRLGIDMAIARGLGLADQGRLLRATAGGAVKTAVYDFARLADRGDELLEALVGGFLQGRHLPLPFAPATSKAYAEKRWPTTNDSDEEPASDEQLRVAAEIAARQAWDSEGGKPSNARIWTEGIWTAEEFADWAQRVWLPLQTALVQPARKTTRRTRAKT